MSTLDHEYFEWLISQIAKPRNDRTYFELFNRLHETEFVWQQSTPGDHNRVDDAMELRREFSHSVNLLFGVSVLEVLIALSRRAAYLSDSPAWVWAWRLIKNLRLSKVADPWPATKANRVDEILYALIWRQYQPSGQGGFFPLKDPKEDQTQVEIWYQMNAYLIENPTF